MTRILLTAILAALALPAAAQASAADGTSNTLILAELKPRPAGFMDYTDDLCTVRARQQ
jgi:hypothetical protein